MKVKNIIIGIQAEEYENCKEFIKLAREKKIEITVLKKGNIFKIDKDTYFEVFFPEPNNTILENKINNNSLVFQLVYKDFSMLFTGDIEESAEEYLVNNYNNKLKSTILKVGHHGSKTSSSDKFINCVNPEIALIGVGENNNFGHPNEEILKRFIKFGTRIYRTDRDGEISIVVNEKIKVNCFIK